MSGKCACVFDGDDLIIVITWDVVVVVVLVRHHDGPRPRQPSSHLFRRLEGIPSYQKQNKNAMSPLRSLEILNTSALPTLPLRIGKTPALEKKKIAMPCYAADAMQPRLAAA
jgi:hypothetical protein